MSIAITWLCDAMMQAIFADVSALHPLGQFPAPVAWSASSASARLSSCGGAAGGHIYRMVTAHDFAPGNAGIIFWTDILVPVVGLVFLWLQRRYQREGRSPAP